MTENEKRQSEDLERAAKGAIAWFGHLMTGHKLTPKYGTEDWRKEVGGELVTLVECVQLMCSLERSSPNH